jgi:hypothetical protein
MFRVEERAKQHTTTACSKLTSCLVYSSTEAISDDDDDNDNNYNKRTQRLWNRKRAIPTEWPPLIGEVSANFCGLRDVT